MFREIAEHMVAGFPTALFPHQQISPRVQTANALERRVAVQDAPAAQQLPAALEVRLHREALVFQHGCQDIVVAGGDEQSFPLGVIDRLLAGLIGKNL